MAVLTRTASAPRSIASPTSPPAGRVAPAVILPTGRLPVSLLPALPLLLRMPHRATREDLDRLEYTVTQVLAAARAEDGDVQ